MANKTIDELVPGAESRSNKVDLMQGFNPENTFDRKDLFSVKKENTSKEKRIATKQVRVVPELWHLINALSIYYNKTTSDVIETAVLDHIQTLSEADRKFLDILVERQK